MSSGVRGPYPNPNPYANPAGYGYPPYQEQPQNTLGLAGFIVSLCGFVFCMAFPVGLVLSLAAIRKEPKGFAIAGAIIGGIGTALGLLVVVLYGAMIAACIGFGVAAQPQLQTQMSLESARQRIEMSKGADGSYPGEAEGNAAIQGTSDHWKTQLRYEPNGSNYVIRSAGPDKQFDTGDDITVDNSFQNAFEDSMGEESFFEEEEPAP